MIKKIIIIMIFAMMFVSCGKKGCPKHPNNATEKCDPIFKR